MPTKDGQPGESEVDAVPLLAGSPGGSGASSSKPPLHEQGGTAPLKQLFHADARNLSWGNVLQGMLVRVLFPASHLVLIIIYIIEWRREAYGNMGRREFVMYRLKQNGYHSGGAVPLLFNVALVTYLLFSSIARREVQLAEVLIPYWLNIASLLGNSVRFNLAPANLEHLRRSTQRRLVLQSAPWLGCPQSYIEKLRSAPLVSGEDTAGQGDVREELMVAWVSPGAKALVESLFLWFLAIDLFFMLFLVSAFCMLCLLVWRLCGLVGSALILAAWVLLGAVMLGCSVSCAVALRRVSLLIKSSYTPIPQLGVDSDSQNTLNEGLNMLQLDPTLDSTIGAANKMLLLRKLLAFLGHDIYGGQAGELLIGIQDLMNTWEAMPSDEVFDRKWTRVESLNVELPIPLVSADVQGVTHECRSGLQLQSTYMSAFQHGAVSARLFCEQLLIGFSYPVDGLIPCVRHFLLGPLRRCIGLVFIALFMAIPAIARGSGPTKLAAKAPGHVVGWVIEVVWMLWGAGSFWNLFIAAPLRMSSLCQKLREGHAALNATLMGPGLATSLNLPTLDVHSPNAMVVWSEARGILTSSQYKVQLEVQVKIGLLVLTTLGCAASVLYCAMQPQWAPGILSATTGLAVLAAAMFLVPALVEGLMLNMKLKEQADVIAERLLEVTTCEAYAVNEESPGTLVPGNQGYQDLADLARAREVTRALQVFLQNDSRNVFRLLGMELTASGLGSVVSAVASACAYLLKELHLKKKMLNSKAE